MRTNANAHIQRMKLQENELFEHNGLDYVLGHNNLTEKLTLAEILHN